MSDTIDDNDELENDGRVNYRKTPSWRSDCGTVHLYCGDCLEVLPTLEAGSVDAVVTDPPYGLSFMGKHWDHGIPGEQFWREVIRVAKPGCHLLAFGGTRTYHRLACAIEDAGWEIRDCVMWVYGSGFPKSHDVSKAIDKAAGVEFDAVPASGVGFMNADGAGGYNVTKNQLVRKGDSTEAARQWQGWGTALKPAWEPIILARKPLVGTVADNVLRHGTGAINVDGCRVPSTDEIAPVSGKATLCGTRDGYDQPWKHDLAALAARQERANAAIEKANTLGRWPANIIHDGGDEVLDVLGEQSRFFYSAKASKADRDAGCDGMPIVTADPYGQHRGRRMQDNDVRFDGKPPSRGRNTHPTVKPTDLMRYLCRLVTPPGGMVLDPFMGSGSTGKAARREGFRFVGIEREAEYHELARRRIEGELKRFPLFEQAEAEQGRLFGDDNS